MLASLVAGTRHTTENSFSSFFDNEKTRWSCLGWLSLVFKDGGAVCGLKLKASKHAASQPHLIVI